MPTPQSPLSDAEREVLKVLWDHGPLGVRDVFAHLTDQGQDWTRSTVVTLLRRLETKRYIKSDKSRYAFLYTPLVSREDVMHARMQELAGELADGDAIPLMLAFTQRHRFSADELARLQRIVDDLKSRTRGKRGAP
jgi:BlaI family transcriptional regulator, penicillinase repressor